MGLKKWWCKSTNWSRLGNKEKMEVPVRLFLHLWLNLKAWGLLYLHTILIKKKFFWFFSNVNLFWRWVCNYFWILVNVVIWCFKKECQLWFNDIFQSKIRFLAFCLRKSSYDYNRLVYIHLEINGKFELNMSSNHITNI